MAQNDSQTIIGAAINVKNVASTTLFATPPGLRFRVTSFALEIATVTGLSVLFTGSLGVTGAAFADLIPAGVFPTGVLGSCTELALVSSPLIVPASTAIVFNCSIATLSTTMTVIPHLRGYFEI